MPKVFKNLGQNDIHLPSFKADPSGMASYDVISDAILIPASPPNFDELKDIVRVTLDGLALQNDRCHKHTFWVNNASSRCMINILEIHDNGDVVPGNMHFVVRQSSHCIPTVRFDGIWSPSANGENWDANGLLVQISGMLSTSWEIQAEIVPVVTPIANPNPASYEVVFEFIFDRIGAFNQVIKGPLTTGTFLPP